MSPPAFIPCTAKELPEDQQVAAMETAVRINPANRAPRHGLLRLLEKLGLLDRFLEDDVIPAGRLAVLIAKKWPTGGVELTVSFYDTPLDVQQRIVATAMEWNKYCNVRFTLVPANGQIRVARKSGGGYYSYLGTDILHIPANQETMNLENFSMSTPQSEYDRVVKHEFGHSLGWPHEHMRQQEVSRLDVQKTIAWGASALGWSATMVRQQILTPLNEASIRATPNADDDSIMCYSLPASITKDGRPIRGGVDIDETDKAFAASIYPPKEQPPPPPPPPAGGQTVVLARDVAAGTYTLTKV